MNELPTSIETADDYINACENFILPLFMKQAKKIVAIIQEIHEAVSANRNLEQEKIDLYINQIKELSAFANPESPMNPYFQSVAALEAKLEAQGLFRDDTKSSSD